MSASLRPRRGPETGDAAAGPRHFLDLRDFDTTTLRQMLDIAAGLKHGGAVPSRPTLVGPAGVSVGISA
ncbi:MAG: hypothetical protein ACREF3_05625, partial [Acetobacteraceae bacterium]